MIGGLNGLKGLDPRRRKGVSSAPIVRVDDWFSPWRIASCTAWLDFTDPSRHLVGTGGLLIKEGLRPAAGDAGFSLGPSLPRDDDLGLRVASFPGRVVGGALCPPANLLPNVADFAVIAAVRPAGSSSHDGILGQYSTQQFHAWVGAGDVGMSIFGDNFSVGASLGGGWQIVTLINSSGWGHYTDGRRVRINGTLSTSQKGYLSLDAAAPISLFMAPYRNEYTGKTAHLAVVSPYNQAVVEQMEGYFAHAIGIQAQLDAAHPYRVSRPEN